MGDDWSIHRRVGLPNICMIAQFATIAAATTAAATTAAATATATATWHGSYATLTVLGTAAGTLSEDSLLLPVGLRPSFLLSTLVERK